MKQYIIIKRAFRPGLFDVIEPTIYTEESLDVAIKMVNEFKRRRDLIVSRLNGMGYETVNAEGAFYVFPKIEDENFVQKAAKAGVITVPGSAFGDNGKNHIRMSYANSYENIEKAMDILEERVVNG